MTHFIKRIFILYFLFLHYHGQAQILLIEEAQEAYHFLNDVRQNPSAFSQETGVDLSYVPVRDKLAWNENLAEAAERKALDMADRDYFSHTDPEGYGMNYWIQKAGYNIPDSWIDNPANNFFESIHAGLDTGRGAIIDLIIDEGVDPPGHRNHLLGIEEFWSNCTDIGIGYAKKEGSEYTYYMVVLIAKHDF